MATSILKDNAATVAGAIAGNLFAEKTVSSGTSWTNLGRIVLPKGTWLVNYAVNFGTNASGMRQITLAETANGAGAIINTRRGAGGSGVNTNYGLTTLVASDGITPIYANVSQTSGSALVVAGRWSAVRLGGDATDITA